MTPSAPREEKKKPSIPKIIGVYFLCWIIFAVLFVGYVSLAPHNGGLTQATANLVGGVTGIAFVPGLILVLAVKGGFHMFPKPHEKKSYYDELKK